MVVEVITDNRAKKFLKSLSLKDEARALGYIELFSENGFSLTTKYLKKIESNLWELRPGTIRLLFGQVGTRFVVVNGFKKKSQKTPLREIKTANSRLEEYEI